MNYSQHFFLYWDYYSEFGAAYSSLHKVDDFAWINSITLIPLNTISISKRNVLKWWNIPNSQSVNLQWNPSAFQAEISIGMPEEFLKYSDRKWWNRSYLLGFLDGSLYMPEEFFNNSSYITNEFLSYFS